MSPKGKKRDTWEPCVTPLKKDQVVDKKGGRKKGKGRKRKEGKKRDGGTKKRSPTKRQSKLVEAR